MVIFKERDKEKEMSSKKKGLWTRLGSVSVIFSLLLIFLLPDSAFTAEKDKVAVLPFNVNTLKPMEYLKIDLQKGLTHTLSQKGLPVIDPEVIDSYPETGLSLLETKDIISLGKKLEARWIVKGSLTLVGEKVSLDLKIVDTTGERSPISLFMVEDNFDQLDNAISRSAESIYNQIAGVIQIDSVVVTGNKRVESEAILAAVESKKGEAFSYEKLDNDLRSIYKMGYFRDVHVETEDGPKGKIVIFKVTEKPSIASIGFSGNKKKKDKELIKEIGIKQYAILNMDEIRQSINRLKEFYREDGYYQANIQERIEDQPHNEVSLIYEIDEGPKMYISKIEFHGNDHFKDSELRKVMETKKRGLLSWITGSGVVDLKKLEYDTHKINAFYNNHGYIRVKVGQPDISIKEGKGIVISLEIEEGPRFQVGEVKFEGDLIQPRDDLLAKINLDNEKYYNLEVLRSDILTLRNLYANQGYAYVDVSPLTREDDKKHLVDITFKIDQNKRVKFERINIYGNVKTRDKVIRRELKVVEGGYFNGLALQKSAANLNRLGYFENVEMQPRKGSEDDQMVLDIGVKERNTGSFSVGVGYSTFDSALAMVQIAQNNLFGKGQRLSANIKAGARTTEFNVSFTEPWLFDRNLSLGTSAYKWKTKFDEYTKDSLGGALTLGFPTGIDEYTRAAVEYRFEQSDIFDIDPGSALAIREMEGDNLNSSVTLALFRDSRDRPWNTHSGSFNSLSFQYAGGLLGGDIYFNKYLAQSDWYFPYKWDTVLVLRGKIGYVTGRSGGFLPVFEKFFLGGLDTVRGYEFASISPLDPVTGDKIGGEKMWVYNIEYRFPILKEQGVIGLVFFDAGNVFSREEDFAFRGRRSVGVGFRWYSPVGPIRVEYGYKLDRMGDEPSGLWDFSMGGTF